jgi:hypothetical protein
MKPGGGAGCKLFSAARGALVKAARLRDDVPIPRARPKEKKVMPSSSPKTMRKRRRIRSKRLRHLKATRKQWRVIHN